uniref:F-box/WD repeat-containing protein 4 n=1 Tax=Lygus hesperus TaxID=30085 RepID=A0A0A9ZCT9_LYGHE
MEPLLLIDGTPQWLQELLSSLSDSESLAEKALILSLVVLMYETGLYLDNGTPNSTSTFDIKLMKELPSIVTLVKDDGRYKLKFNFLGSPSHVYLAVIPTGSILMVNLLIPDVKVVSCVLTISDYIDIQPASAPTLKNNSNLSILFKNHVDSIISFLFDNVYSSRHLLGLPVEILTVICTYLTPQEFVNFGKTCTQANAYLENDHIWKSLARLYLPSHRTSLDKSWKKFVIYQFQH